MVELPFCIAEIILDEARAAWNLPSAELSEVSYELGRPCVEFCLFLSVDLPV